MYTFVISKTKEHANINISKHLYLIETFDSLTFIRRIGKWSSKTLPNSIHRRTTVRIGGKLPIERVFEQRTAHQIDGPAAIRLTPTEHLVPKSTHERETHQRRSRPTHRGRAHSRRICVRQAIVAGNGSRCAAQPLRTHGHGDPQHVAGVPKLHGL